MSKNSTQTSNGVSTRYTPTIGLEVHAELKTKSKMFCSSKNEPHAAEANVHTCPVCMAFPGTLPTINKEAVRHVLTVGAATSGTFAEYTEFDRKNYFYPDIPKGYQISQYKYPLISGGSIAGVLLTRIHLEEDTARSQHTNDARFSLVDFNRAGVPLMELVTEPVIHDAETAVRFAQELQLLLRTLGVSDANMEKGEMRVEANISVSASDVLGTKVEVKNLNSFKVVSKAIEYEIARQIQFLESDRKLEQETRGWDENTSKTFSQRSKEDAQDYRYFPEPDLPKLNISRISEFSKEKIHASLPELPEKKRSRYSALGLKSEDVDVLLSSKMYQYFFDTEILSNFSKKTDIQKAANYLFSDVRGANPSPATFENLKTSFVEVVRMLSQNLLSSRGAKNIIAILLNEGGDPRAIAEKEGLLQVHDEGAIKLVVEEIINENPAVVAEIKDGKKPALQFLVGQGMKKSKGAFNPEELVKILHKQIGV